VSPSGFGTEPLLRVGELKRPHGLAGEVSVAPVGDFPDVLGDGSLLFWRRDEQRRELRVLACRPHGERFLVRFAGVEDVESARALCGGSVSVPRSSVHPAEPDFVFEDEIEGYECVDRAGAPLGRALAFERYGPSCCLVIEHAGEHRLVPYAYPIVVRVDREGRRIVLDPPDGLL
jgi:16S rRNA processing protein RimM